MDRGSVPRSPDVRGKQSGLQVLGNVGIIELLEQDERPTFIVDVANQVNFLPGGPLQIVFANGSLRAYEVGDFIFSFSYPILVTFIFRLLFLSSERKVCASDTASILAKKLH